MTTICGTTLNETGERVLKIFLICIPFIIFLTGLIMCLTTMHHQHESIFAAGIVISLAGIVIGVLFLSLTKCCGCNRYEYEPISERPPILV